MLRSLGEVTKEELEICSQANIKEGMLGSAPDWMVKWMSIIFESISKEGEVYREQLKATWSREYPW